MVEVRNLKIYRNLQFEEYLKLPGESFSGIRSDGKDFKNETKKMRLGTLVHRYLLTPEEYDGEQIEIVRPLAIAVKQKISILIDFCEPEISFTCDFVFNGMSMPYRGRADLGIMERLILDLKVSEMPLKKAVDYFRYDYQQSGYAIAFGASLAIIISIHPKLKHISTYNVPISHLWWEHQILQRGNPL